MPSAAKPSWRPGGRRHTQAGHCRRPATFVQAGTGRCGGSSPKGQTHWPSEHTEPVRGDPALQLYPHWPQEEELVLRSTQAPWHQVWPARSSRSSRGRPAEEAAALSGTALLRLSLSGCIDRECCVRSGQGSCCRQGLPAGTHRRGTRRSHCCRIRRHRGRCRGWSRTQWRWTVPWPLAPAGSSMLNGMLLSAMRAS